MHALSRQEIELLAEKKLAGTISPLEEAMLDGWVQRAAPSEMRWRGEDKDEEAFRARLLARIRKDAAIGQPTRRIRIFMVAAAAAAAAVLLVIGAGLAYRYIAEKKGTLNTLAAAGEKIRDLPPGHNGAILTLGNGQKIVLDSASNGSVAVQGPLRLVKSNGVLAYEKSPDVGEHSGAGMINTMATPRGREFEIVLSDGTRVWLNAASSITYPSVFKGEVRKVSITGEAYFEVAKDEKHPFIVSVDGAEIAVLGTHFDVMAYSDERSVKTTLLEGSVKVTRASQAMIILPGQQASFPRHTTGINLKTVDALQSVAWVKGKLSLDNLDVRAVMRQVSRWYNVDVEFEGPVPEERFWGVINRNLNLSSVLNVMKASGINARLQDGVIIISAY